MSTPSALAAATPESRDRYVDFLRAFSILTVVCGHWLIAIIIWEDQRISVDNAVGLQRGLWLVTWVLQVMPIFFFVGGFANAAGWDSARRRGMSYGAFLRSRLERLLWPTAIFAAVWTVIEVVLHLTDTGSPGITRGTFLPFGPLWFLAVYVVVVAASPLMLGLHRRHGMAIPIAIAITVAVIDAIRFATALKGIGWANLLLVWLAIHQVGFFYADGRLVAAGRRTWWAMVATGLAVLVVLTNLVTFTGELWYPRSMVGVDIEPVSNMSPPSAAILALALWQVGAAMLLRAKVSAWLARPKPWTRVVAVNSMIMTLFLWHLSAMVAAILILHPLGFGGESTTSARWWLERPLWVGASALVLAPLVIVFSRWERRGAASRRAPKPN
ncbi:MAG: acyltransferase [Acidimicrobiia bacterium]|nr:acyltransferase [Acidimicrobiia bacterium]